ncbi:hypothetical protein R3X27_04890 [Tropicimonas sp. TH_r6]|uniref:hypothetical protein n=1 Tax=Tropicimonas sp. TH_r6 TaxID=3082085 RepID=UPI0029553158|nr:hypothetical protein [Tropicimonas sp. TH_r6]MDV7142014.1 hypothetical protein [Tropicimonas sp. TH_r6]
MDGIRGLDDTDARNILRHGLEVRGEDPLVLKAITEPEASPPNATVADAKAIYATERVGTDKDALVRLDRTCMRLADSLGPLDKILLTELRREHGRNFRDHMLSLKKDNGKPLALGSVKRELGSGPIDLGRSA